MIRGVNIYATHYLLIKSTAYGLLELYLMTHGQLALTDMVYGSGAELAVELLCAEVSEVVDGVRPKMEDVVPGERVPLLDHHHFGSEKRQLDGRTQATGASADDQTLRRNEEKQRRETCAVCRLNAQVVHTNVSRSRSTEEETGHVGQ